MKKIMTFIMVVTLVLLFSSLAIGQKALILVGDNYSEAEAELAKATIASAGFAADIVKVNPDPANRGFADAVDVTKINYSQYDLFYFTWNAPGHDGKYFLKGAEDAIRSRVENGGVVWMSAFDDNFKDESGNQAGLWFPIDKFPAKIINTADSDIEVTAEGKATGMFNTPNAADLAALILDDNFAELAPGYVVLANRTDGQGPAAIQLPYGKGYYVGMCIDTRDAARLTASKPLIENALFYLAKLIALGASPVNSKDKLAVTWGSIKK